MMILVRAGTDWVVYGESCSELMYGGRCQLAILVVP